MAENRDTVGKLSNELIVKPAEAADAIEQMREQLTDYDKNLLECAQKNSPRYNGRFYIVSLTKKERLMQNVLRSYFFSRATCPTPDWDQTVYMVDSINHSISFMWVIPSRDTCDWMYSHALDVPLDQKELLNFVIDFKEGILLRKSKKLNNEVADSNMLINKGLICHTS